LADGLELVIRAAKKAMKGVDPSKFEGLRRRAAKKIDPRRIEEIAEDAGRELLRAVGRVAERVESVVSDMAGKDERGSRSGTSSASEETGERKSSEPAGAEQPSEHTSSEPPRVRVRDD
jgi:hypothetical protein